MLRKAAKSVLIFIHKLDLKLYNVHKEGKSMTGKNWTREGLLFK